MKVVILGGGGFLGKALLERLISEQFEIVVFDKALPNFSKSHEKIEWIVGDFSNIQHVEKSIQNADVIVHLISTILPKGIDANLVGDLQNNVTPTLQLLDKAIKHKVKKVIFVSSGGTVYGEPIYLPIDEKHPTNPLSSYAVTKLMIEKYLLLYHSMLGLNVKILRVTNPYGEYQRTDRAQGAIGIFLSKALCGQPINIWGDGSVIRDYIYVHDVADALNKSISYEGTESIFNISSGVGTSLNELAQLIEKITGFQISKNYLQERNFDVHANVLSNKLAREELGWMPNTSLIEGVTRTFNYMKNVVVG